MSTVPPPVGPRSTPARLACAAGAVCITTLMTASLLGLFQRHSSERWLQPTPDLLARTTPCQRLPGRAEQVHCVQAVVAAYRAQPAPDLRMAAASAPARAELGAAKHE
jgi:hypothetical protein